MPARKGQKTPGESAEIQQDRVPSSCPTGFQDRYTVQAGDSLFSIAQRFNVSVDALIDANPHISNPNVLYPGDVLCVPGEGQPGGRVPEECPPGTEQRYTVEQGDTFISIARKFLVSFEALIAYNPHIPNPNILFPGDVLCIPVGRPLLPCCVYLSVRELDARGSALVEAYGEIGRFSTGILVEDMPSPSEFGDFNAYRGEVVVPDMGTFTTGLFPVEDEPSLLAGRVIFSLPIEEIDLPRQTQIWVRPINTETNDEGPVLLKGSLTQCIG